MVGRCRAIQSVGSTLTGGRDGRKRRSSFATGTSGPERTEVLAAAVQRVRILPAMVPVTPTITSSMVMTRGSSTGKDTEHRVKDPVCGMWVDRTRPSTGRSTTASRTTSARRAAARSSWPIPRSTRPSRRRRPNPCPRARSTPAPCILRSGRSARLLPDLRHGPGTGARHGRHGAQSRARRLHAPLLDRDGAHLAVLARSRWAGT